MIKQADDIDIRDFDGLIKYLDDASGLLRGIKGELQELKELTLNIPENIGNIIKEKAHDILASRLHAVNERRSLKSAEKGIYTEDSDELEFVLNNAANAVIYEYDGIIKIISDWGFTV